MYTSASGLLSIDGFHSRDRRPYWSAETIENIWIRIELRSHRIYLGHKYGRHSPRYMKENRLNHKLNVFIGGRTIPHSKLAHKTYMCINKMFHYTRSRLYYANINGCMSFHLSLFSSINNGTVKSIVFLYQFRLFAHINDFHNIR